MNITPAKIKSFQNAVQTSMFHSSMLLNMIESCEEFLNKDIQREENEKTRKDLLNFLFFLSTEKKRCGNDFDTFFRMQQTLEEEGNLLGDNATINASENMCFKKGKGGGKRKFADVENDDDDDDGGGDHDEERKEKKEQEGDEENDREEKENNMCKSDYALIRKSKRLKTSFEGNTIDSSSSRSSSNTNKKINSSTFYITPSVSVVIPNKLSVLFSNGMKDSNLSKLFKISCLIFKIFNMEELFIERFQSVLCKCEIDLKEKHNRNDGTTIPKNFGGSSSSRTDSIPSSFDSFSSSSSSFSSYSSVKLNRRFIERLGNKFSETNFVSSENIMARHLENLLGVGEGSTEFILNTFLSFNLDMSMPGRGKSRVFLPVGSGITNKKLAVYVLVLLKSLRSLLYSRGIQFSLDDKCYIELLNLVYKNKNVGNEMVIDALVSHSGEPSTSSTLPSSSSSSSSPPLVSVSPSYLDRCACYCHTLRSETKTEYFPNIDQRTIDEKIRKLDELPLVTVQYGINGLRNKGNILSYTLSFVVENASEISSYCFFNSALKKLYDDFVKHCIKFVFRNSSFSNIKVDSVSLAHLRFLVNFNNKNNKEERKRGASNDDGNDDDDADDEIISEFNGVLPEMETKIRTLLKNIDEKKWKANVNLLKKGCNIVGKTSRIFKYSSNMFARIRLPLLFLQSSFNLRPDDEEDEDVSSQYRARHWPRRSLCKMIERYSDSENNNNFCREVEIVISDRHHLSLDVKISPKFHATEEIKK